jgi:integrase/recombinase XerD
MTDLVQNYLKFLTKEKGYAENTIAAYRNDLTQFSTYADEMAYDDWSAINQDEINTYIDYLKNQTYSSSTVARKVAAIKSFFNFLIAEKMVEENPTTDLDAPKVKKRLPDAISIEDVNKLLEVATNKNGPKSSRDRAMIELLYASGMRVTELVSLDVDDLDFDNKTVSVKGKKSGIKERIIPIPEEAMAAVSEYVFQGRKNLIRKTEDPALFLNHRGQRLTRQGSWLIIKRYVQAADISDKVTPHTLRHSFAAHKLSLGQSLQDIQKLLGHANISTTQVYAHLSHEEEGEKTP